MKVLHIVKTNKGAAWAFEQAKWLYKNGIDIVTVLPENHGGYADKYKFEGMKIIKGDFSLPVKKPYLLWKRIKEIRRVIEDEKPDIIHCHFVTNILMTRIALRKYKIKRLFQVPGPLHLENWIFRKLDIILSNEFDYWISSCKKTYNLYRSEKIENNRNFLAYYGGYGGESCDLYRESSNILHKEYNISEDSILVGMVSYFYKPKRYLLQNRGIKGHEDFIDSLELVRKEHPNVIGIIIGGPWQNSHKYESKIKKYAKEKCGEGIIFTGFRNDIKSIYKELDIAVHPSHSENLGGAAESLAAGVPTISTNIGGFPDIVLDGKTGYAVNKKKPVEIADAIKMMINNKSNAKTMACNGQKLVRNMLDINKTSEIVKNIYLELIK